MGEEDTDVYFACDAGRPGKKRGTDVRFRWIPVNHLPTTILAFDTKQQFYHIFKIIIIPAASNDNFSIKQYVMDKN
jgi:hypothetical protein